MDALFHDFQSSLGFLTITVNRLMSALFRKRLIEAGIDLTPEQWGILAHLWNEKSVAQDELAALVCVDKSSLSRVLDVMERRRLVRRERAKGDARKKLLFTTPEADALRDSCNKVADDLGLEIVKDCAPEEVDICRKVLNRIKLTMKDAAEQ